MPDVPCTKSMRLMAFVGSRSIYIAAIVLCSANLVYSDTEVTVKPLYGNLEGRLSAITPRNQDDHPYLSHLYDREFALNSGRGGAGQQPKCIVPFAARVEQ